MAVEPPPSRQKASTQPSWLISSRICWMVPEETLTSTSLLSAVAPTAVRGAEPLTLNRPLVSLANRDSIWLTTAPSLIRMGPPETMLCTPSSSKPSESALANR